MIIYSVHNCDLVEYEIHDLEEEYVKMVTYEEAQKEIGNLKARLTDLQNAVAELLPRLPTESEMLDYASLNEGRASDYDVCCVTLRFAYARSKEGGGDE